MLDLLQVVQLLVVVDLVVGFPLGPGKELGSDLGELLLEGGIAAFAQDEVLEGGLGILGIQGEGVP